MKAPIDPFAIFAPPIITLVVLVLGYVQSWIIRRGQPLTSIQRKLLFYGTVFTLGMCYAIAFQDELAALFHWQSSWIAVMVAWGALLAAIAWMRHRRDALPRAPAAGDGGV